MVEPYHGYIYVKKGTNTIPENIKPSLPNPNLEQIQQSPQQVPLTSGLPILTPLGFPKPNLEQKPPEEIKHIFNPEKYKDLLVEKPPIKYLPPEVIPRERYTSESRKKKYYNDNQSRSRGRNRSRDYSQRRPRVRSYDYLKEKQKGDVFNKDLERHTLNKYRYDIDVSHKKLPKQPNLPITKLEENDLKQYIEKKILMMKPYVIPVENPEIIEKQKSKKKTKIKSKTIKKSSSSGDLSVKIKKDKPEDVINSIDKSDKLYKEKFEKLKKAYIKKHKTLLKVFDGYQTIYDEYTKNKKN